MHLDAPARHKGRHVQNRGFPPRERGACHGQNHRRCVAAERGETRLPLAAPAAIVLCNLLCQPLGSVGARGVVGVGEIFGHIVKDPARRIQPLGHLAAHAVDETARHPALCARGRKPRKQARGNHGKSSRGQRDPDDVLPVGRVDCKDLPHDGVHRDGCRRRSPPAEGGDPVCRRCRQDGIGEKVRRGEGEHSADTRESGKREHRGGSARAQDNHQKERVQSKEEVEALHLRTARREAENHGEQSARNHLVWRESGLYTPQKHSITYGLCAKRHDAREHRTQHGGGDAVSEKGGKHGVRELGNDCRRRHRERVNTAAETEENDIYPRKDENGHGDEEHRPRVGVERHHGERVHGRDDEEILPGVSEAGKQPQRERASEFLHRGEEQQRREFHGVCRGFRGGKEIILPRAPFSACRKLRPRICARVPFFRHRRTEHINKIPRAGELFSPFGAELLAIVSYDGEKNPRPCRAGKSCSALCRAPLCAVRQSA